MLLSELCVDSLVQLLVRRKICDYPHVMRELLSDFNTSVLKEDITPMLLSALRLDNRRFRISRVTEPD